MVLGSVRLVIFRRACICAFVKLAITEPAPTPDAPANAPFPIAVTVLFPIISGTVTTVAVFL